MTRQFLTECQKVVNYFLLHTGFSIGIGDTIANAGSSFARLLRLCLRRSVFVLLATLEKIETTIATAKKGVTALIRSARLGKLERQPGVCCALLPVIVERMDWF